jgi:hypothetical protein
MENMTMYASQLSSCKFWNSAELGFPQMLLGRASKTERHVHPMLFCFCWMTVQHLGEYVLKQGCEQTSMTPGRRQTCSTAAVTGTTEL